MCVGGWEKVCIPVTCQPFDVSESSLTNASAETIFIDVDSSMSRVGIEDYRMFL